ncbi:MAG TPA: bifunctional enoyl-CoA hydratase/phosphate acetyltransferase, partial [Polyangiaceae bacterium]|nr:bifunctional enoyl-CoA hydratase/phosphate acetyltransferase [Polyangiaceae bacterium]
MTQATAGRLATETSDSEIDDETCLRLARVRAFPAEHRFLERVREGCRVAQPLPTAVAAPMSDVALRGAFEAAHAGLIVPILVGPETELRELAAQSAIELGGVEIVHASDDVEVARACADLCRSGRARLLMKGSIPSEVLLHEIVRTESGLRTSRRMSHVFILDVPAYPRPLFITDAAVNIYPSLADKVDIVVNAIELARLLGVHTPNVAILSAVETVHAKIQATLDAAALSKMAERGQIQGAIIDGPLAFDTAVSAEAARIKHLNSAVAGAADILVVPDMESGNMLVKQLEYL